VGNSEPRVGQKFELEFTSEFLNDYLRKHLPPTIDLSGEFASSRPIERDLIATKPGPMTIGPFKFKFNGKRFKTNSITINVQPPLEAHPGLWIRKVINDGVELILIEQIVKAEPVNTFSSKGTGTHWSTDKDGFTELVEETNFEGVTFDSWGSGWGGTPNTLIEWPMGLTYSYKFFKIIKSDSFKGPLKLRLEHFNNWPKDVPLPEIVIQ
jgi:hypothetical protein